VKLHSKQYSRSLCHVNFGRKCDSTEGSLQHVPPGCRLASCFGPFPLADSTRSQVIRSSRSVFAARHPRWHAQNGCHKARNSHQRSVQAGPPQSVFLSWTFSLIMLVMIPSNPDADAQSRYSCRALEDPPPSNCCRWFNLFRRVTRPARRSI
jgi:hypothetical protein